MSENELFTRDQVELLQRVAASESRYEEMKAHMGTMASKVFENHKSMKESIDNLTKLISTNNDKIVQCRKELRDEIERDFVTIPVFMTAQRENEREMHKIESKVDKLSTKITVSVSVAMIAIFSIKELIQIGLKFVGVLP